jgi:hypothetical protein
MTPAESLAIKERLQGLRGNELEAVASASLQRCEDLECQKTVLAHALQQCRSLVPEHVGEGARVMFSTGSAIVTGLLRGAFGPTYGRFVAAAPAVVGLTIGLTQKDINYKASPCSRGRPPAWRRSRPASWARSCARR